MGRLVSQTHLQVCALNLCIFTDIFFIYCIKKNRTKNSHKNILYKKIAQKKKISHKNRFDCTLFIFVMRVLQTIFVYKGWAFMEPYLFRMIDYTCREKYSNFKAESHSCKVREPLFWNISIIVKAMYVKVCVLLSNFLSYLLLIYHTSSTLEFIWIILRLPCVGQSIFSKHCNYHKTKIHAWNQTEKYKSPNKSGKHSLFLKKKCFKSWTGTIEALHCYGEVKQLLMSLLFWSNKTLLATGALSLFWLTCFGVKKS